MGFCGIAVPDFAEPLPCRAAAQISAAFAAVFAAFAAVFAAVAAAAEVAVSVVRTADPPNESLGFSHTEKAGVQLQDELPAAAATSGSVFYVR